MRLTASDERLVWALCGDLPESLTPFEETATRLGLPEKELLARLEHLRGSGVLRRFGATVNQRKLGYLANAMAVWQVPEERIEEVVAVMVSCSAVTHCYQRQTRPGWPYNLYAMLHGKTREECEELAASIARTVGCPEYRLLFSVREFKKSSPSYSA
jgi:DNA-binding Lrp family transcriptional regulator